MSGIDNEQANSLMCPKPGPGETINHLYSML
jgi:hypothetical protein